MKKIKFVKVCIDKTPIESFLYSVKKEFVIEGYYFKDCETIEEMRDKCYNEMQDENIRYIQIWTFTSKKNLENDKQFEYIGE